MFGEILQELRKDRGWTQAELGKQLGVSKSAIGSYESGISEPSFENLTKIADIFHVNTDYLLGHSREQISWADLGSMIELESGSINLHTLKHRLQALNIHDRTMVIALLGKLSKLEQLEHMVKSPSNEVL